MIFKNLVGTKEKLEIEISFFIQRGWKLNGFPFYTGKLIGEEKEMGQSLYQVVPQPDEETVRIAREQVKNGKGSDIDEILKDMKGN